MHGLIYDILTSSWTILDDPSGIGTTTLNGINDLGQVVGFYVDANDNTDGFLANPTASARNRPPSCCSASASPVLALAPKVQITSAGKPSVVLSAKHSAQTRAIELEAKGTLASEKVLWMRLSRVVPKIQRGYLPLCAWSLVRPLA
jgi:hypothetical protein